MALIASTTCLSFTYLWDDYHFLNNALSFRVTDYLPAPTDGFYRPLSRGVYFQLLGLLGDAGARVGHVLNAILLLGVVSLFTLLVRRLAGVRVAVLSGLAFVLLAPTPFLVGWVSGDQDLLGMLFILAALHSQLSGRTAEAVAATALSLLCKETAAALIPVLVGLDWILGRRPYRFFQRFGAYGALVLAWALFHPGVRSLVEHGFRSGVVGYVGAGHPEHWLPWLCRYLLTMLNIPTAPVATAWILDRVLVFLGVGAATFLALTALRRSTTEPGVPGLALPARLMVLGALMAGLPLLVTTLLVGGWTPYYAVYPGLGSSILLGMLLARTPTRWAVAALGVYFLLGVCSRAGVYEPGRPTEYNLSVTSKALRKVEAGFKTLRPVLPQGSQVLVAVQAGGLAGLYTQLYAFQAMQAWYRDPTLETRRPDWRRSMAGREFLFWIAPTLDVFEIDLPTLAPRTNGPPPDWTQYQKTLRYYARGLANCGETDQGVRLLLYMPSRHDYADVALDRRLAAMLLFHDMRDREAEEILRHVPPITRSNALEILAATLASPAGAHPWDDDAFRAFGLAVNDTAACRDLMHRAGDPIHAIDAERYAQRLLRLKPGDGEAVATIRRLSAYGRLTGLATPAPTE